jgi:hypothetical protein
MGQKRLARMYVSNVFRAGKRIFLTVVSGPQGTAVYLDGVLVRQASGFLPSVQTCTGSFVVGDSPRTDDSFRGELTGLAIHQRAFTPEQVALDYQLWKRSGSSGQQPETLYVFNERAGSVIRDRGTAGVNLSIPEPYRITQPILLNVPWIAYEPEQSYLDDILINIGGFAPFGFTLSAFLALRWRLRRAGLIAVLAGFLASLTIETLQFLLPTRNSDLTDVLTNTLGTWIGVLLYREWTRRVDGSLPS